jgi:hypothetical protein
LKLKRGETIKIHDLRGKVLKVKGKKVLVKMLEGKQKFKKIII